MCQYLGVIFGTWMLICKITRQLEYGNEVMLQALVTHIIVLNKMNRFLIHFILSLIFISILGCTATFGQTIFTDNFEGGRSSKWRQINDGMTPGQFHVRNGSYFLISSDAATSIPRAILSDLTRSNYFLQAQVRVTSLQDSICEASIVSYYSDSMHYYEFSYDTRQNYWSLQKVDKTGNSLLARGSAVLLKQTHHLGLYVKDGDIRAFLDGVMVAQKFDPRPLPPGGFGISARGAEAEWRNVVVKVSNPQDFFYSFFATKTDSKGKAAFQHTTFQVTNNSDGALSGIRVFRIYRDGVSYFIFQDPGNLFATRSGFMDEFESTTRNEYKVVLLKLSSGTIEAKHRYSFPQTNWLFMFLKRSARFSVSGLTADLKVTRNVFSQNGTFELENVPVTDAIYGSDGQPVEMNGLIFGRWQDTGNYNMFPSLYGKVSNSNPLSGGFASLLAVPQNSKFDIYNLRLNTDSSASPASITWIVQQDSRGIVVAQSASFPKEALRPGSTYTVPCTLVNSGEKAGPFTLYFILSKNSSLGKSDTRLKQIDFEGMDAKSKITREVEITIPLNMPVGRYFIGTLLETKETDLRVLNGTATLRAVSIGEFPSNGRVEIMLTWNDTADLDLHVTDPFGETIHYFRPSSISGGNLIEDVDCSGPDPQTERVEFPQGSAASGTYLVSIHYFRSCNSGKSVQWSVNATVDGKSQTFQGIINPGQYIKAAEISR
jgi:3-keto-disaccharide hydrolase